LASSRSEDALPDSSVTLAEASRREDEPCWEGVDGAKGMANTSTEHTATAANARAAIGAGTANGNFARAARRFSLLRVSRIHVSRPLKRLSRCHSIAAAITTGTFKRSCDASQASVAVAVTRKRPVSLGRSNVHWAASRNRARSHAARPPAARPGRSPDGHLLPDSDGLSLPSPDDHRATHHQARTTTGQPPAAALARTPHEHSAADRCARLTIMAQTKDDYTKIRQQNQLRTW